MADVAEFSADFGGSLDDLARQILHDNDRGGYTVPSSKLYPFQWNWDSAFVALGWAEFDRDRAWLEIEKLIEARWPSGMIPHIVFWSEESTYFPGPDVWQGNNGPIPSSGISQPPVLATVIRHLVEADGASLDRAAAVVDAVDSWHRWWHSARDPEGLGVIAVAHPWESGRDNLPDWDKPLAAIDTSQVGNYERRDLKIVDSTMRPHKHDYDRYLALVKFGADCGWDDKAVAAGMPFWVADPATTAILLRAEQDLLWLFERTGRPSDAMEVVASRIDRMTMGFERFWNTGINAYCSIDLRTGAMAEAATSASFLAPYAGVTNHLDEVCDLLTSWTSHCNYLVPSFDPRHIDFEPNRYWRGPVWSMVNFMIYTGLIECGREELAAQVKASSRSLVEESGFPESFNPITGMSVGGPHFAWTAALWLAWGRTA